MRNYRFITALAAIAALLTACSESSDINLNPQANLNTPDNAVQFSTYMGRGNATRGGAYGSINTAKLADPDYGFGVFAYQTETALYNGYRTQDMTPERYPNFMYNERIIGDGNGGWKYADVRNTKYWPNEVGTGAVDDQNNDSANDPATTNYANGGNVSFYAYAPYADFDYSADSRVNGIAGQAVNATNDGTASGIIAFSGNLFNGGHADNTPPVSERCKFSDPYLTYRISGDSKKQVDLLWGTAGTNGVNVLGAEQPGVAADSYRDIDNAGYPEATRPKYNVNSDLTKQKTNGTVDFAFKHALAKIGGSFVGTEDNGSDEDGKTPTNGLMVILDIDKDGKEFGGSLQPYAEGPTATTPYNTKVTVNEIVLQSEKQLTDAGKDAIVNNTTFTYDAMTEDLRNEGIFNLVTGVWHDLKNTNPTSRTQTIEQTSIDVNNPVATKDADVTKDAVLNHNIAEPRTASPANWTNSYTKTAFEALPIGVTTVAKNVYENEAQPFVFIPGTYPVITITIDYTVRTYDAKLAKKYSEVRQRITKRLYILDEIELNKQYNILMHLGLTSLKFTATVSDWEVTNATGTTIDPGDGTSPVTTYDGEEIEHIYLPINVAGIAKVNVAGADYDVPADNTITLPEQAKDATSLDLGVITFTRSDGTTLKTDDMQDATLTATVENVTGAERTTFITPTVSSGAVSLTFTANSGVKRSDRVILTVTSPAGINLATLNVIVPQAGEVTTPQAAVAYAYSGFNYTGTFTAVDANNMNYDIDITAVGITGENVMNDFARILGALYRAGGVTTITFDGKEYTWDESIGLAGSNWSAGGVTLVSALVNKFKDILAPGKMKVTLITDRGDITFNIHIKSSAELAAEYIYSPAYTYNGTLNITANNVTYTYVIPSGEAEAVSGQNIMNDMARFLGGLYRAGGVTALNYKGKDYTWNDALTMVGSRWTDGTKTLIAILADEFRFGVPDGTQLKLTTNMGDIVFTVVITE